MTDTIRNYGIILLVLAMAAAMRILPHPPNFTPVIAMGLFSVSFFRRPLLGALVPIGVMILSDLVLGSHQTQIAVYISLIISASLGLLLTQWSSLTRVCLLGVGAASLFFLCSNFAVFALGHMYPHSLSGLLSCYLAAIPFFHNTLLSTLLYGVGIWSGYRLLITQLCPVESHSSSTG